MNSATKKMLLANSAYLLCCVLLLLVQGLGQFLPSFEAYSLGYNALSIGLELLALGLPLLLVLAFPAGRKLIDRQLFGKPGWSIVLVVPMAVFAYFMVNGVTVAWLGFLGLFGATGTPSTVSIPGDAGQLMLGWLVVGIVPALVEELVFRGLMQCAYSRLRPLAMCVVVGAMFALLHGNMAALAGHLLLGIIICAVVYMTGSIYSGMLLHFMQNCMALFMAMVATKLMDVATQMDGLQGDLLAGTAEAPAFAPLAMMIMGVSLALGFAVVVAGFLFALYYTGKGRRAQAKPTDMQLEAEKPGWISYLPLVPAGLIIVLRYVGSFMYMLGVG